MSDTPATSFDPAMGSEGDSDQLAREDTLIERGVDDLLDEGYSPPERDNRTHYGETPWEERHRETIDQRVGQEEPEVWEQRPRVAGDREEGRAGRLVADTDAVSAGGNDEFAIDAGISGGAATAEEAAMHLVEEEFVDDRRYHDDDDQT
ncbi:MULTISPECIES: DUF5709 domain-containing protein [Cellulomonas]|uniref:DUF5709 domain-containing protein n=1 Tax=Cellulomonas gilvus (strain ATCC 13127 / NRRL B-14078) TaxID=593907 RepID=F7ZZM5_CELGA|nr:MULTISPECIES: DUF5709 domain-containing protein [Cellulomonas]AEI11371.1 hypothetical protein Celgi_0852 [Cellulomonas gilvus ATCC 13127]MCR6687781.1 DUF5709 domain-containing protein [Cellulomonas sp.]